MNKGLLIFILLIPAFAALGYDAYVFYENQEEGFKLTDLGWLWTNYHQGSHDSLYEQIGEDQWKQYMLPVLQLPAVIVALILGGTIFVLTLLLKGLGSLGSVSRGSKKGGLGRDRDSKKKFQYNRR